MIVVYESGDNANVEDNIEAGEMASQDVTLIRRISESTWEVESLEDGTTGMVKEYWLSPR